MTTIAAVGTDRQVSAAHDVLVRLSEVSADDSLRDAIARVRSALLDAQDEQ